MCVCTPATPLLTILSKSSRPRSSSLRKTPVRPDRFESGQRVNVQTKGRGGGGLLTSRSQTVDEDRDSKGRSPS